MRFALDAYDSEWETPKPPRSPGRGGPPSASPGGDPRVMLGAATAASLAGSWSSLLPQPLTYSLGELINVEAAVRTPLPSPLRVFVDECVASLSTAERPRYHVIANGG